jgi:hypothetical protein
MSILLAPVVIVGAALPGQRTPVNVAVNGPVCVSNKTKFDAVAVRRSERELAVNEHVCVAAVLDSVLDEPELP